MEEVKDETPDETCGACRFFYPYLALPLASQKIYRQVGSIQSQDTGLCRRYPPNVLTSEPGSPFWNLYPVQHKDHWCGEWDEATLTARQLMRSLKKEAEDSESPSDEAQYKRLGEVQSRLETKGPAPGKTPRHRKHRP